MSTPATVRTAGPPDARRRVRRRMLVTGSHVLGFGLLGAVVLSRSRHRTAIGRVLAAAPGDPRTRRRHLVLLVLLALVWAGSAGYGLVRQSTAAACPFTSAEYGSAPPGLTGRPGSWWHHGRTMLAAPATGAALTWAAGHGGTICRSHGGEMVAVLRSGYARAGTTVGNTFLTSEDTVHNRGPELYGHEGRHVDQWALVSGLAGPLAFPLAYITVESVAPEGRNVFERWAGLSAGGYDLPDGPGPGPSRVALLIVVVLVVVVERGTLRRAARGLRVVQWPPPPDEPVDTSSARALRNPSTSAAFERDISMALVRGQAARGRARTLLGRRLTIGGRVSDTGDRHASWLELLFDAVAVVAFIELAGAVIEQPSWAAAGRAAALLVPLWWQWEGYAWYCDRYDSDDAPHRAGLVLGMLGFVIVPFTIGPGATAGDGFVGAYLLLEASLTLLYLRAARRYPATRTFALACVALFTVGLACWATSLLLHGPARYGLWAAALSVEILAPLITGGVVAAMPLRDRHVPERLGLFTLLSLGAAVLLAVDRLHDADRPDRLFGAGAFALALSLWWLYFAFVDGRAIHAGHWPRAIFNYAHLPLWIGLWATAVGVVVIADGPAGMAGEVLVSVGVAGYAAALAAMAAASRAPASQTPASRAPASQAPATGDAVSGSEPAVSGGVSGNRIVAARVTAAALALLLIAFAVRPIWLPAILAAMLWITGNTVRLTVRGASAVSRG